MKLHIESIQFQIEEQVQDGEKGKEELRQKVLSLKGKVQDQKKKVYNL